MFKFKNDNRGLVKWIFLIILAVLILSYLGFDLRSFVESEGTQSNLQYVWGGVVHIWGTYLVGPFNYLWNDVFLGIIWSAFTENMDTIKGGGPIIDPDLAPKTF